MICDRLALAGKEVSPLTWITAAARGDLRAYQDSVRSPTPELVDRLRELLGARLVAYVGSVKETRAVRQWAAGEREPSAEVVRRLRTAYHAAALLAEKERHRVSPNAVRGCAIVLPVEGNWWRRCSAGARASWGAPPHSA